MTAEPDLLPCPFCGGEPKIRIPQITDGYPVHVRCRCGVEMYGGRAHFATGDDAIAAWNGRATAAKDAEIEALRAEVEALKHDVAQYMDAAMKEHEYAERLAEALRLIVEEVDDLLASHPKATTYPDGPCIEKQSRSTLADARDKARTALEQESNDA